MEITTSKEESNTASPKKNVNHKSTQEDVAGATRISDAI
jgi:hypothetical protein